MDCRKYRGKKPEYAKEFFENEIKISDLERELELLTGADDSDFIAWATRLSQKNRIGICAGYAEHAAGQRYNTSLLTGRNGEIVGKVRKVHLWKSEKKRFAAGNEYPVFETEFGKLAVLLCYDMEFPEPARIAALRGAELILCPAAWSKPAENRWRLALPASALFNLCFVAGANYSDALCCGGSGAFSINNAISKNVDILISSDFKYHDIQSALENSINIIDLGHYESEVIVLESLLEFLNSKNLNLKISIYNNNIFKRNIF